MIYSLKESVHKLGVNIPNKVFEFSRYFLFETFFKNHRNFLLIGSVAEQKVF